MKRSKQSLAASRYWRRYTPAQRKVLWLARGQLVKRKGRSNLENVVAAALTYLGISFEEQCRVAGYRTDFYLPRRATVVEVDGRYWHSLWGRPVSDLVRDEITRAAGFRVVRLRQDELESEPLTAVVRGLGLEHDY